GSLVPSRSHKASIFKSTLHKSAASRTIGDKSSDSDFSCRAGLQPHYGVTLKTAAPTPLSVESPLGVVTLTMRAPGLAEASRETVAVNCVPVEFTLILLTVKSLPRFPLPLPPKLTEVAPVKFVPLSVRANVAPPLADVGVIATITGRLVALLWSP